MASINLREFSAPIEALRDDVKAAYDRLDTAWGAVATELSKLPIPCTVGCQVWSHPELPEIFTSLEWRKWNGKRRLCITTYHLPDPTDDGKTTPYEEWSGEQRCDLLSNVPELFKAAEEQTKKFIERAGKEVQQ